MNCFYGYDMPLCRVWIGATRDFVTHVLFEESIPTGYTNGENRLTARAAMELTEYFAGVRKAFDLPIHPSGTEFMLKVWGYLSTISYGETKSYGDVARGIGNPKACRAVGSANNKNPISIIIPCHRVIGADGSLTGYGGGLPLKEKLLALEKSVIARSIL